MGIQKLIEVPTNVEKHITSNIGTLHVCIASDTQKIQSSDLPK